MKGIPTALQAHLEDGTTTLAWCWRVTRSDGAVFGFTDHDRALDLEGTPCEPRSGFTASELRAGSDLAVDAQEAEGVLSADVITETDILAGLWDNAAVEVWRVNWQDTTQRVLMRSGAIGQIRRGKLIFVAEMRSLAHLLNQTVGRTFQHVCDARLGDGRCRVDLEAAAFKGAGIVTAITSDRSITASGLGGFAADWFTRGVLDWTSGANAGLGAEITGHMVSGGIATITLAETPVHLIAPGDGFTIRAGCDKRIETCAAKFANTENFRGFPHMPGQDTIVRYAGRGEGNTGAVL